MPPLEGAEAADCRDVGQTIISHAISGIIPLVLPLGREGAVPTESAREEREHNHDGADRPAMVEDSHLAMHAAVFQAEGHSLANVGRGLPDVSSEIASGFDPTPPLSGVVRQVALGEFKHDLL